MFLNLLFGPRDPESLRDRADEVSDPAGGRYGAYLDRGALAASFEAHAALDGFLERCGMQRCDAPLAPWVETWSTSRAALVDAFGRDGANELLTRRSIRDVPALRRHSPALRGVEVSNGPRTLQPFPLPARAPAPATRFRTGLAPDVVRRGYAIPDRPHGDGETIAVMALGGVPDRLDLERFWDAHGIAAPDVRAVAVGPLGESADDPLARLETTMGVQWIGAIARALRIVVYLVDPATVADPWSTFLAAVLADRAHAPTIAVTSWSAPERQYHRVHGRAVFAELLDQATAIGVTVVAASGDWGAFDGMPRARGGGPRVCDAPAAHATFPGSEPRVLSVGGTHVIDVAPWQEHAWSAPIPATLRAATGLDVLAGSGGFSASVPIPSFQRAVLREAYPRSSGAKAIANGRAQPDVALAAWGLDDGDRPTGYRCLLDGELRDDGGGTSVAAPVWAALIACLNEARRANGKPRLGACAPLLYRIAQRTPHAFRAIVEGTTDIVLPVAEGRTELLPGFVASEGWNPAVGLGVPRGDALLAAVLQSH